MQGLVGALLVIITPICKSFHMVFSFIHYVIRYTDAQYRYGDIRLVGGSYQWEGRVEIFISETWGTITDSEWTNNDAQVVCRKLGHFKPGTFSVCSIFFQWVCHILKYLCGYIKYYLTAANSIYV